MLTAICSAKGSPGVTSLALAVAAWWPEGAILLEADPTGTDLAYRCQHASGREVASAPNLSGLATAVRSSRLDGPADPGVLGEQAQPLACGARLIPGILTPAQARGMVSLWGQIAHAAEGSSVDVVADLGRLNRTSSTLPVASAAAVLLIVCQPHLESVMHAKGLLSEVAPALTERRPGVRTIIPVVVGPARQGPADAADVDKIMGSSGLPVARAVPVVYDPGALAAIEAGGNPHGRLARSPLMRSVKPLVALIEALGNRETAPAMTAATWEARSRQ